MKNIIRFAMSALLALGFAYAAKSQACGGVSNTITYKETSSALGQSNKVYGKSSTAIGLENTVSTSGSTNQAFAMGYNNQATAKLTFAFGDYNKVTKAYSFAIGSTNTVNANTSIAIGCWLKNTVDYGITIGFGNQKSLPLVNNTDGIMMGMNSDKPTFFISSSSCDGRTGRVGIGNVTDPQAKLHIKADNYSYDGEDADILLEPTRANKIAVIYFKDKNNSISVSSNNKMYFNAGEYNFVNGVIRAEEVVVELMKDWPDYVFNDDYQLTSLEDVKKFIDDNGHLPGVPSAGQVSEEGVKLGEINTKLLEKIEELTLYIIQQEERIQALENKLDSITKN